MNIKQYLTFTGFSIGICTWHAD